MDTATDVDNRDKDEIISMLEARVEVLAKRVVELMAENQMLSEALTQARWQAARIIQ